MLVVCICFVRTRLFYFVPLDNLHRRCLMLRCGSESYTMLRMVTDAHAPVIHILYAPVASRAKRSLENLLYSDRKCMTKPLRKKERAQP